MTLSHRSQRFPWAWTAALGLALCSAALMAAEPVRYQAQPGGPSVIRLDGSSSVGEWNVESKLIGGFMMLDATFPEKPGEAVKMDPKVEVIIPVSALKSGKSAMDNVMYRTLKHEQNPRITYKLTEMTLKEPAKETGGPMTFDTKGELTVAGVKKAVPMLVTVQPLAGDKLKVAGSTQLKMTEFGMDPPAPTLAFGLLKASDDVKVTFEWVTEKKAKSPSAN